MLTKERVDQLVDMDIGRVDISIYTDEAIFQEEMQRIFYTAWVYVGHESEVAQPGDYKTSYVGQVPVILSRDEDNQVHVLVNRCAHRGPTVCQLEYGNASYFRCEYHGWVYGNDGSLTGVSLRRGFGPGELDGIKGLDHAEVDSYHGLVFARLTPGGPSLRDQLGLARQYLDDWADRSPTGKVEVKGGVWKHTYAGNWKLQLEGSNEGYHPDYLHKISRLVNERVTLARGAPGPARPGSGLGFGTSSSAGIDLGNGHSIMGAGGPAFNPNWRQNYPPEYVERIVARVGEERASQVLGTGWRMQLFPNAAFAPNQIRVIRPIAVDQTEVLQYHVVLPETSQAQRTQSVKGHQGFYGPAGYGSPDDLEMFARMYEGYRSSVAKQLNQWAYFSRGRQIETRGPNGERFGHTSSEVEQRSIYYAWTALMKGESHVVNKDPASGQATAQVALNATSQAAGGADQP